MTTLSRGEPVDQAKMRPALMLAFLVAMALNGLDATIVTPALPRIATDLGAEVGRATAVEWVFLVAAGLALPAAGWAGNRFVPARVLSVCAAVFAVGCVVAVVAPTLAVLVAARAVQGIASGLMVPVGLVMAYGGATGANRLRIARWTAVPLTLVPMLGPLLGGSLTQHLGWRSMFVLLFAVACVVCASTWWVGRGDVATVPGERLDMVGLLLVGGALLLATVALPAADLSRSLPFACLVGCLVLGGLAWRWCSRRKGAIVSPEPLTHATFRAGLALTALSAAAVNALLCAVPVLLVTQRGYSTTGVGLALTVESAGVLVGAKILGVGSSRMGVRRWVLVTAALAVPSCVVAVVAPGPAVLVASVALGLVGVLLGQPTMLGQALAFDSLAPDQIPSATVLLTGLRSVASAWGVVLVSLVLSRPDAVVWCALFVGVLVLALLIPVLRVPARLWANAVQE